MQKILFFYCLALWPSMKYLVDRTFDASDEPWGIFAALAIFVLFWTKQNKAQTLKPRVPLVLLCVYSLSLFQIPALVSIVIGLAGLGFLACQILHGRYFHQGCFLLHLLCAPLLPSICFFTGYPVRLAVTYLASALLQLQGFEVEPQGTTLQYLGETIFVDAPCAGIKLLWLGLILTCFFSSLLNFGSLKTWTLIGLTSILTFCLNVLRVNVLFFSEAHVLPFSSGLQERVHTLIGLSCTLFLCAGIYLLVALLIRHSKKHQLPRSIVRDPIIIPNNFRLCMCCLILAFVSLCKDPRSSQASVPTENPLPEIFYYQNQSYTQTALEDREKRFSQNFPGYIQRYKSGDSEILLRSITKPTRKLHPSSDCLKGAGFSLTPASALKDSKGDILNCVYAKDELVRFRVCEKILDKNGKSDADVSSWYWKALLGYSEGPWLALSLAERLE